MNKIFCNSSFFSVGFLLLLVQKCSAANNDDQDSYYAEYGLSVCSNGIAQVTNITATCDSPYTYYWGSGVNRNSVSCKYGDKLTAVVDFDIIEDLDDDITMYTSVEVQNDEDGYTVALTDSTKVKKYTNSDVNGVGSYQMTYQTSISSSDDDSTGDFVPYLRIAFSSQNDGGYNLGGANIDCYWDNDDATDGTSWKTDFDQLATAKSLVYNYGLSLLTIVACSVFVVYLYSRMSGGGNPCLRYKNLIDERNNPKEESLIYPPSINVGKLSVDVSKKVKDDLGQTKIASV